MKAAALSISLLLLLLSAAGLAAATFQIKVEAGAGGEKGAVPPPNRLSDTAAADPQPQKSAACEAVKAEGCAM